MNGKHVAVLARLEARRQRMPLGGVWLASVLVLVVMARWELAGSSTQLAVAVGLGLGTSISVPMKVAEDKMRGQMGLLTLLPTETANLVAARFVAVALAALLWAVTLGAVVWAVDPALPWEPGRTVLALSAAAGWWVLLSVLGWILVAALALFDLDTLTGWPLIGVVALWFGIDYGWGAWAPRGATDRLLELLGRPWAPEALAALVLLLCLAAGAVAFGAAVRGLDRYVPSEEEPV